jgi:hypothetical protein
MGDGRIGSSDEEWRDNVPTRPALDERRRRGRRVGRPLGGPTVSVDDPDHQALRDLSQLRMNDRTPLWDG